MREALIQRLRQMAGLIPESHTVPGTAVSVPTAFLRQAKILAEQAADALENDVDIPIYDQEEIYHNCTVQVLYSSYTGDYSVGWWKEGEV